MLLMRQFDGVEKIKTIGSTYMAAAGLKSRNTHVVSREFILGVGNIYYEYME